MNRFWALLRRDLLLAVRQGGGGGMAVGFFLVMITLIPLSIGPDLNLLSRIAPGVVWSALLLSGLLTLEQMFQGDFEDGSLEAMLYAPLLLEWAVVAKALAHWMTTGLPLALMAPIMGLMLNIELRAMWPLIATLLLAGPALSFIGAVGAALTIALRRGGILTAILVLPLCVPILIFGVSAVQMASVGGEDSAAPLMVLGGLSLLALAGGPVAASAALRAALR